MSKTAGPAAFLAARYAEDWARARDQELAHGLDESRLTRDIDAKRQILAMHGPGTRLEYGEPLCARCSDLFPCDTVLVLVAVFSDHPDYDEGWTAELDAHLGAFDGAPGHG